MSTQRGELVIAGEHIADLSGIELRGVTARYGARASGLTLGSEADVRKELGSGASAPSFCKICPTLLPATRACRSSTGFGPRIRPALGKRPSSMSDQSSARFFFPRDRCCAGANRPKGGEPLAPNPNLVHAAYNAFRNVCAAAGRPPRGAALDAYPNLVTSRSRHERLYVCDGEWSPRPRGGFCSRQINGAGIAR